jgi:LysM repeat protein
MLQFPKHPIKKLPLILLALLFAFPSDGFAQRGLTIGDYIDTYSPIAMQEMRRHGIPASIKLAQGILESGFGNSELAVNANNHFGIKCHGWPGRGYNFDDDAPNECFRLYDDPVQSYLDHSQFLLTRPRYAFLFELGATDYRAWAHGLRRAGYATNPNYPQKLIRIIEEHNLTAFDQWAMNLAADLPAVPDGKRAGIPQQSVSVRTQQQAAGPREEFRVNRIRTVRAREGDTPESIAREMGLRAWQIVRYNELEGGRLIVAGQNIFLQPKRRRGEYTFHVAEAGQSMYGISQAYGIQLEHLYRRNNMSLEDNEQPFPGQRIRLRGRTR